MNQVDLPLNCIRGHGTQVRVEIDQAVVADYAERMDAGDVFPAVTVFHDGTEYHMGDGFHRYEAARRLGRTTLLADVTPGGQLEAIWFALGANRTNGKRLTELDKQHAVAIALRMYPHKLHIEIAAQVGCSTSLVSKESSKFTGASGELVTTGRALLNQTKREAVQTLVAVGGRSALEIAAQANVSKSFVSKVRAEIGKPCYDRTKEGVVRRRARMRELAADGHTSIQIAGAVGMSVEGCRAQLKHLSIEVPADRVVGKTKRLNANRITDTIVMDAANLTAGVELIDFAALDRSRIPEWLGSLHASREKLGGLIRRLMKEQQHEVA